MMNRQNHNTINCISYLDVSEYIIKEHSPMLKASPEPHHHHDVLVPSRPTVKFKKKR